MNNNELKMKKKQHRHFYFTSKTEILRFYWKSATIKQKISKKSTYLFHEIIFIWALKDLREIFPTFRNKHFQIF